MKAKSFVLAVFLAMIAIVFLAAGCSLFGKNEGTLSYNANGGTGTVPGPQTAVLQSTVTVATQNGLTKSGYWFYCWNTKNDGSGTDYAVGSSYKMNGDAVLFAKWVNFPYYPGTGGYGNNTGNLQVVYYPDASNPVARAAVQVTGNVPVDPNSYAEGTQVTVKRNDAAEPLEKEGYVFAEWVDHPNYIYEGKSFTSDSKFQITGHKELWALWLPEDKVVKIKKGGYPGDIMLSKKLTFPDKQVGYNAADLKEEQMTALNTLPVAIGPLTITITGDTNAFNLTPYNINGDTIQSISPNGHVSFSIIPKTGLAPGNYSIKIEIKGPSGSEIYAVFIAGFVVTPYPPAPYTPPSTSVQSGPPYGVTYLPGNGTSGYPPVDPNSPYQAGATVELADAGSLANGGLTFGAWRDVSDNRIYVSKSTFKIERHMTLEPVWLKGTKGILVVEDNSSEPINGLLFSEVDYGYTANDPKVAPKAFRVYNVGDESTGPIKFKNITRNPVGMQAFILYDKDMNAYQNQGAISLDKALTDNIEPGGSVKFSVKPVHGLDKGNYSVTCDVSNDAGSVYADFILGFVVHSLPLYVTAESVVYLNKNPNQQYLTPLQASNAADYSERAASFEVSVSGFLEKDTNVAAAAGLVLSKNVSNGVVIQSTADMAGLDSSGKGANTGVTTASNGYLTKTFTVTVTLNDSAPFADGETQIYAGLEGLGNSNYETIAYTEPVTITIRDGQAATENRVIPVNTRNTAIYNAFNAYAGTTNGLKRHYKQMENITLTGGANNWTAIGSYTSAAAYAPFTGSYDGGGKIIRNLTIINPNVKWQGMFGNVGSGGEVKKLGLVDVKITTPLKITCVGGVAGVNYGTIEYCYSTSIGGDLKISGDKYVGGVVGLNYGILQKCYSTVPVTGDGSDTHSDSGGVAGANGVDGTVGQVLNCYATGSVTGYGTGLGGVVGSNNNGIVQNCYATGAITGTHLVAGVVGWNSQKTNTKMQYLVALNPSVSATNYPDHVRNPGKGVGRVVYNESGANTNSYARDDMAVTENGDQVTTTSSKSGTHGEDITATQWESAVWWRNTMGFLDSVWDFSGIGNGINLPTLRNMPAGTQNPEVVQ